MKLKYSAIAILILLCSCNDSPNHSEKYGSLEKNLCIKSNIDAVSIEKIVEQKFNKRFDPNPENTKNIKEKINSILKLFNEKCTKSSANESYCNNVLIQSFKAPPLNESLGLRVLIIDDQGMKLAARTRYRNKVLNYFKEDDNGYFIEDNSEYFIPRAAKKILYYLLPNNNIPYELLEEDRKDFIDSFEKALNYHGHSTTIFNFLANASEKSQFVLIEESEKKFTDMYCSQNRLGLQNLFIRQSNQIIDIIQRNNINFISYSKGISINTTNKISCNVSDDFKIFVIKEYYKLFLNNITEKTNAILVQANATSKNPIDVNDEHFYADCQKNPRRIRVGFYSDLKHSIKNNEKKDLDKYTALLSNISKNSIYCTDIYINFSTENEKPYRFTDGTIKFSSNNFDSSEVVGTEVSSSNAVPVALSYLLYLKTKNPILSNNDIINIINNKKEECFVMIDPYFNKELPYDENYFKN